MFRSSNQGGKKGKGHIRTYVYGRISSTPEGDGKVACLAYGVRMTDPTPLGRLWPLLLASTNDRWPFADVPVVAPSLTEIVEFPHGLGLKVWNMVGSICVRIRTCCEFPIFGNFWGPHAHHYCTR